MLAPIFTHGTYENTVKAIQDGKIKYPSYCWITDRQQYGFLNKNNQLEVIGIPEFTGTLDNVIVLSTLDDGLYYVKGRHKITSESVTTFQDSSDILVVIQTVNGIKKIRRITADEIVSYTIEEDMSVTEDSMVGMAYLKEQGYVTGDEVDDKIAAMKEIIMIDVEAAIPDMVEPLIDSMIQPVDGDDVRGLFE